MAILESVCLDLGAAINPMVSFAYHMAGESIDSLRFEIIDGSSVITPLVILDKLDARLKRYELRTIYRLLE